MDHYHDVLYVQLSLASRIGLIVGQIAVHVALGDGSIGQTRQAQELLQILVAVELKINVMHTQEDSLDVNSNNGGLQIHFSQEEH